MNDKKVDLNNPMISNLKPSNFDLYEYIFITLGLSTPTFIYNLC